MPTNQFCKYDEIKARQLASVLSKFFQKAAAKDVVGDGEFEVIATTQNPDRDGESILVDGWDTKNYLKNPVVLYGHDYYSLPIGVVKSLEVTENGIIARGIFAKTEFAQTVRQLYDDGILKSVSVGFIPLERNNNTISKAELLEISFVPVPANPEALSLSKIAKLKKMAVQNKMAMPPHETPMAPEDMEWDAGKATQDLEVWAKGDSEQIDFTKFQEGFAWYDKENADKVGSYKLPHHDVMNGELQVVWQGVVAAMAALLGAQGGVDIPEDDKQAVYDHLAAHYKQFDKEPPELKSYTQYELDQMYPAYAEQAKMAGGDPVNYILEVKENVDVYLDLAIKRLKIQGANGVPEQSRVGLKEGRVLSTKNRTLVDDARKSAIGLAKILQELLDASEPEKTAVADNVKTTLCNMQSIVKVVESSIRTLKQTAKDIS